MADRVPTNVISRSTVTQALDAADAIIDNEGFAALDVPRVAAWLGWHPTRIYRYFTSPADLAAGLVGRDRGTYAHRLHAAGLKPAAVAWLLDRDPSTVIGIATALDRTGGEDAWDLPVAYTPTGRLP